MDIKIYTDGACEGNPGPGGWAALILIDSKRKEISGGEKLTTNKSNGINRNNKSSRIL